MISKLPNFKNPRTILAFSFDMNLSMAAFWASIFIRYESFQVIQLENISFIKFFIVAMALHAISYIFFGLYRVVWRFASIHDLLRIFKAVSFAVISSLIACVYMIRLEDVPRSMFIIEFLLLIVGLGGSRFLYRYLKDRSSLITIFRNIETDRLNVLIVGAGRAGEKLLRDINRTPDLKINVVGFVDDNKFKKNVFIHNTKVFGETELIPQLIEEYDVKRIFIAIPSATSDEIKRIVRFCKQTKAEIKILPTLNHQLSTKVDYSLLRNLRIEDLLGREQVELDTTSLEEMIEDKIILVTGAGGSIGSELCIQISKFKPRQIIMVDTCELFLYELDLKFRKDFPYIRFTPKILDIRNEKKLNLLFERLRPDIVFHAAAYKHVPMMEYNPAEAVETNIKGTQIVAEAALKSRSAKFVLISTDKAVNPTNVMGASKRIAEMVIANVSKKSTHTKFMAVRFGNVLGSNGSVIPLFRKQIENQQDLTVTHPEITRYFMSIPEASQLVLQAASLGNGNEIFVLEMGQPVKIVELAQEMIRLAGLIEGQDINIVYTGLRPGEKLYEELFLDNEKTELTSHGKIRKVFFSELSDRFETDLEELLNSEVHSKESILKSIQNMVPEFNHLPNKN